MGIKKKRIPWKPIKLKLFQLPKIIEEDVPWEKRLEAIKDVGRKAQEEFQDKYYKIAKWFEEYDQLYLLSYCSMYFMASPEGIDPEAEGPLDFYHHYLEILQAFALINKRTFSVTPLFDKAQKLKDEVKEVGEITALRSFAMPDNIKTKEEIDRHMFLWNVRNQTTAIRNWAYRSQMKRVTLDLAQLVNNRFKTIHDLDAIKLFETLFGIVDASTKKLNNHLSKLRSFSKKHTPKETIHAYELAFPDVKKMNDNEIDELWKMVRKKLKSLRQFLYCHADLRIDKIYSVDLNEIIQIYGDDSARGALKRIFDSWSIKFGELKNIKKEHIILGNPIHLKPFIKISEDSYYSSILGIMAHLSLDLLESLISDDQTFLEDYNTNIKSGYLENEVERIFSKGFPSAQIIRGSKYPDPDSNDECENDLLVLIDSFAIVVEAKSGTVTSPARRGAPDRLTRTIEDLVDAPAHQANRFITFLQDNPKKHTLYDINGNVNEVDSSRIKYYVPLGVTFESLGSIGSNLRKIINAGILNKKMSELAPSMCFTDLESVFELLPLEAEKIHYLIRRREFEAHVNYEADEIDLLGFYLDNGFNIGIAEYSGKVHINLLMKSKELDPYFDGIEVGADVKKPGLEMSEYWNSVLNLINVNKLQNWIEVSFILLNTSKEDQQVFLAQIEELIEKIDMGELEPNQNWINFITGPDERKYLIVGFPYRDISLKERDNVIRNILGHNESLGTRGAICIGIDLEHRDHLYGVLVSTLDTDLFVDLDLYGANIKNENTS